jgi:hypothetical protein
MWQVVSAREGGREGVAAGVVLCLLSALSLARPWCDGQQCVAAAVSPPRPPPPTPPTTAPSPTSTGTSLPSLITSSHSRPSTLPLATSSRSRSPADRWVWPYLCGWGGVACVWCVCVCGWGGGRGATGGWESTGSADTYIRCVRGQPGGRLRRVERCQLQLHSDTRLAVAVPPSRPHALTPCTHTCIQALRSTAPAHSRVHHDACPCRPDL